MVEKTAFMILMEIGHNRRNLDNNHHINTKEMHYKGIYIILGST